MRRLEHTITPDLDGQTVEAVTRREMRLSRHVLIRAKYLDDGILLDGQRVRSNTRVCAGQLLSIAIGDGEQACAEGRVEPISGPVDVVFEDDDVIVLNKPAGIVMYSYDGIDEPTLGNYLMHYLAQEAAKEVAQEAAQKATAATATFATATRITAPCRLHPVHRLDRGTSGLVVFAKNAHAQHVLQKALHTDAFVREYMAVCHGEPRPDRGTIDAPIARAGYRPASFRVSSQGKPARTHYEVQTACADSNGHPVSFVLLRLETGRTHQIRVHMASIGCPLAGDALYGGIAHGIARPALHSARLSFVQPISGERIELQSVPPEDMQNLMAAFNFSY